MNIESTPLSPDQPFIGPFLLFHISPTVIYLFLQENAKKKLNSIEQEQIYIICSLKFNKLKVCKSFSMGYVHFLQHLFMRMLREEGSSKTNTSQNLFFTTLSYTIQLQTMMLFVLFVCVVLSITQFNLVHKNILNYEYTL